MKQLGVDAIDFYVWRGASWAGQLGWAGHVRRMDFDRLPRRMLSSRVPHKRPRGAPRMRRVLYAARYTFSSRAGGPPRASRGGLAPACALLRREKALLIPKPCPENVTIARPSNTVRSV